MRILGVSAFHRDAAAVLLVDGCPVAAAQEERFTNKPLDPAFPSRAIRFCLDHGGVTAQELDHVVFYEKPLKKFERVLAVQMQAFPRSASSFAGSVFLWLGDRLWIKNRLTKELNIDPAKILFTEHQHALAANAYYCSPFDEAAVLTVDDVGEWATASIGHGSGAALGFSGEVLFPHSLGLFASAMAQFLGFVPGQEEHKVEALSAYGKPTHAAVIRELVPDEDGYFSVNEAHFRFAFDSDVLYRDSLKDLLGAPRYSGDPLLFDGTDTRHADIAASVQVVLEERVLGLSRKAHEAAPVEALCFAGELATNRRVNATLLRDGPFERLFVPSAPGKAGAALGAALFLHHAVNGAKRSVGADRSVGGVRSGAEDVGTTVAILGDTLLLGEAVDDRSEAGAAPVREGSPRAELIARLVAGQVVAWVRGPMEFGASSVGNRCLLAMPSAEDAKHRMLAAVQQTEAFLPCRLFVPEEHAEEYFEIDAAARVLAALGHVCLPVRDRLVEVAACAVEPDRTSWPRLVSATRDPELHALLLETGDITGQPILLTSEFRLRGSTLVRSEAEAVHAFERSSLDALIVADRVYEPSSGSRRAT